MTKELLIAALLVYGGFMTAAVLFLVLAVHVMAKKQDEQAATIEILESSVGFKNSVSKPK